ncbi:MAG TPA: CmcI family methyltransferase [Candidatus Paceibacterota bacterium]|nr:CmcI family methyltransferase [Candidatus Paceibacterota bacterium]
MKERLIRLAPRPLLRAYVSAKKALRRVPKDEQVRFDLYSIDRGHHRVTYRGVPMIRCPFDYAMYQMIVTELQPDLVIEIGTNRGGTTLYIADLLDILGHGTIHSIDLETPSSHAVTEHPRIKLFRGGWQGYDLALARGFSKVMVIEDASHMYEDCIGALNKFSPLVSVGSYYIVEDGILNELGKEKGHHGGPLRAIREFLATNASFIVDRAYCDMFGKNATFNTNGYLKRIH